MRIHEPAIFDRFSAISASYTTKDGGVSKAPYESLNLAYHVGDNNIDVDINHMLLSMKLGYDYKKLVIMNQIHSDKIYKVDETHDFAYTPSCDALITNMPQAPLMAMGADCAVVLLYDSKNHAIAAIHAGRKGAFLNIISKTVDALREHYGTNPKDIIASIGASIRRCCYHIDEQIVLEAKALKYDYAISYEESKFHLDVVSIIHKQLKESHIDKIEINRDCTSCRNDTYYSYRADNKLTGRNGGVIYLH